MLVPAAGAIGEGRSIIMIIRLRPMLARIYKSEVNRLEAGLVTGFNVPSFVEGDRGDGEQERI